MPRFTQSGEVSIIGAQIFSAADNCGLAMLRINVWRAAQTVSVDQQCLFEQTIVFDGGGAGELMTIQIDQYRRDNALRGQASHPITSPHMLLARRPPFTIASCFR